MQSPDFNDLPAAASVTAGITTQHCNAACHAYHTVWPFMRLFGIFPAVARDHRALRDVAGSAARAGRRKILISGASDFGLLAYVIDGYATEGLVADVTVTDLCGAPLALNHWYAERKGWTIQTILGDIRGFQGSGFDLIIAHNFLNFFDPEGRRQVVSAWARALAPGGQVALFATIRPGAPATSRRFGPAGLDALVEKTLEARRNSPHADLVEDRQLEALVRAFGERRIRNSLQDFEGVKEALSAAGLRIAAITEGEDSDPGVASDDAGQRYCIIAEKPAIGTRGPS